MSEYYPGLDEYRNEILNRLANSVDALVDAIREQASTERTVDLSVERIAGPAVGEPIGYLVLDKDDDPRGSIGSRGHAEQNLAQYGEDSWSPYRVVAVYDLPTAVQP